uniref:DDE Tnp4 domain-containing protein n=1 Tax=Astyanax mexicanus TaxID=7994 RepID=A0A8B9HI78_ASTMX
MPPAMFDEIVGRLTPRLTRRTTNWREPLSPGLKVALTLRHLASGVCLAIVHEYLAEQMTLATTEAGWRHLADEWYRKWNFPHTIGAVDGKHVACKAPPNSGSEFYIYKGFFSIILLGVVSSDYKFIWADVSGNGSSSDAHIYNHSDLQAGLENGDLLGWPHPDPLPNDTQDVPYILLGDDAFSLRTHMMKPYGAKNLTREERIFNYRLSRGRRVVENAFGILANRFQVLLTTMSHHPENVRLIVKACILLHNVMRTRYPVTQNRLVDNQGAPNRASKDGKKQRNLIKQWINSPAGSVPWQDRMHNKIK